MAGEGERAKVGDVAVVHYTGKLEDGVAFDSSIGAEPLKFTIGAGQMIPGFEEAVIGMAPGETKVVQIPPEKAYGHYKDERVIEMNLKDFPEDIKPEIGMMLQICESDGRAIPVQVTDVIDDIVTLDANHPLSERTLTFEIQLVAIEPKPAE
jgi:FKBP-type peptidyl-prolyl cis-trans isomerase 2